MSIIAQCWKWRSQVGHLAWIDLVKTCRGAVLGWVWLAAKPAVYIFVFWFALALGLRAGGGSDYPYIAWLSCGLIPWFFMSDMLNTGSNVYRRYPFLVNKIRFPLPAISAFFELSKFIVYVVLFALFVLVCVLAGVPMGVQAVQIPLIAVLMYLFFLYWSVMTSPLSALSKDFGNLVKTLSMPLFWLSGVIFDLSSIAIPWVRVVLAFNPVTFFAEAHRLALCDGVWLWERPEVLVPFLVVFAMTVFAAVLIQRRIGGEVADVL